MTISRRDILGLGSLLFAGCGSRPSRRDAGAIATLVPTPYIADDDGPPPAKVEPEQCSAATAANIEGPFYKAGSPHRAVLADDAERGERLVIAGTVLTIDCAPVAGAELDVWQADARGGFRPD